MRLKKSFEWIIVVPAILFGRHVLPWIVICISLFINTQVGLYMGLAW